MAQPGMEPPTLTAMEGYAAMQKFLENYWIRGDRTGDDIAMLLSSLAVDPAQPEDWLEAIKSTKRSN